MNSQKKFAFIAGGVVVVLGCAWWGLSAYAANKAEDDIVAFLNKNGVRDAVHWNSISASPFGSATLNDVVIGTPSSPFARIQNVEIKSFRDEAERKSGDVVFRNAALADGDSPLSKFDFIRQGGKVDLPPGTLSVKWDLQRGKDEAEIRLGLEQPDAFNATLNLGLDRVNALVAMGDVGNIEQMAMAGLFGLDRALGRLKEVQIKSVDLNVKDEGYVKRSIELHKRYNVSVVPGEGSAEKQRKANFEQSIDTFRDRCIQRKELVGFADNNDACKALVNFLSGKDRVLKFVASPRSGVPLSELVNTRLWDFNKSLALFSPKLSN